jgi:5-amino-6-(5-phosphoribosylamino)uracil reductase
VTLQISDCRLQIANSDFRFEFRLQSSDFRLKFEEFAARKSAAACAAALERWDADVDHPGADQVAIGNAWTRAQFGGDFYVSPAKAPGLPSANVVFVQSADGNTGAANPSSLGGGETDKHVIYEGLSRVGADAVLSGAETLRRGDLVLSVWHPELVALRRTMGLPRHPVQIVASLRGIPLDTGMMFNLPDLRVIIVTVPDAAGVMGDALRLRPWIETIVMASPNDLSAAFRELHTRGIGRISAIGGRTVARALIDAALVEDLYLTTSAKAGGEPNTPLYPRPLQSDLIVRKHGTGADQGVRFEHLRLDS